MEKSIREERDRLLTEISIAYINSPSNPFVPQPSRWAWFINNRVWRRLVRIVTGDWPLQDPPGEFPPVPIKIKTSKVHKWDGSFEQP